MELSSSSKNSTCVLTLSPAPRAAQPVNPSPAGGGFLHPDCPQSQGPPQLRPHAAWPGSAQQMAKRPGCTKPLGPISIPSHVPLAPQGSSVAAPAWLAHPATSFLEGADGLFGRPCDRPLTFGAAWCGGPGFRSVREGLGETTSSARSCPLQMEASPALLLQKLEKCFYKGVFYKCCLLSEKRRR